MQLKQSISPQAMAIITNLVASVNHGTITLIVQDGRLLQVERHDKIRLDAPVKTEASPLKPSQSERLMRRLEEEIKTLLYGQVVLSIKNGLIVQIERTEKLRSGLEGIYGDGI